MSISRLFLSRKPGFLLMEALLAVLLLSSFSVVIGMYWNHLYRQQSDTQLRLQALALAIGTIDELNQSNNKSDSNEQAKRFAIVTHRQQLISPRVIKGALQDFDAARLVSVTVSWNVGTRASKINLSTLDQEHV